MKPGSSIFGSSSCEEHWVEQVSKTCGDSIAIDIEVPPCVFRVPKTLAAVKPEAYVPHLVGLGPNHHFRPDLYAMEGYKLAAVKRFRKKQYPNFDLQVLVGELEKLEPTIRACYNNYLNLDTKTLAWVMAIDGLFFLDFCGQKSENDMGCVANFAGISRKLTEQAILRDVMMLENQIPLVLLKEILKTLSSSSSALRREGQIYEDFLEKIKADSYDVDLYESLLRFIIKNSPLNLAIKHIFSLSNPGNLLDFMYQLTVNNVDDPYADPSAELAKVMGKSKRPRMARSAPSSYTRDVALAVDAFLGLGIPGTQTFLNPFAVIKNLPWGQARELLDLARGNSDVPNAEGTAGPPHGASPEAAGTEDTATQLTVPTVSQLHSVGVKFSLTPGIRLIKFEKSKPTLYLPEITLNVNSETILRNLVAFEASSAMSDSLSASLELAGYIDLMNGIIDSAEDVRLMRENKIIKGRLSDGEIASMFNGMTKSIEKSDEKSELDKTVEELNDYYNNSEEVKTSKLREKQKQLGEKRKQFCLNVLKFLTTLLVVLLLSAQAFCQVYGCSRFFAGKSSVNSMLADI